MVDTASILVVEDERIVALDIQDQLLSLGYNVPATVARGEEAILLAAELAPALVLMDIRLKGDLDGIEAAQHIRTHLDIPVIFLTAFADEATLQRAKMTDAYGYLLKPFEERELHTAIEMALYKHEMERKMRQSQQWLAATLNSIGDAVIATDERGRITFMNPVAETLTGWSESEARNRELKQILRVVHRETREPIADLVRSILSKGTTIQMPGDSMLIAKDGREIPIDDSAAPIRDLEEISGTVVVFRDITEQVRAREALTQYAAELETRNAELDAFSHTVAHDLKDPLSTVLGCAQMLRDYWPTMSDQDRTKFLTIVSGLGLQACNIVDELLLLATVRSSEVATEPLHMASIVRKAEQRLSYRASEAQAEIVLPESWPIALGYGPWVEEVWVNYISNAIKYGGSPPHIKLGATAQSDGYLRFWVRDDGPGIAAEDQARLFMPFTQLDQIRVQGHGLGLSIVRRIMEKLGGEVGVESTVGKGSTFYFTLPRADAWIEIDGPEQLTPSDEELEMMGLGMCVQDHVSACAERM
jgi:two-component system cell cycle sensor histidine kinase/response regulator CckA